MNTRFIEPGLWLASLLLLIAGVGQVRAVPQPLPGGSATPRLPVAPSVFDTTVAEQARVIVLRNPFRFDRAASAVRYGATPVAPSEPEPPRSLPALTLLGTMGGPPWLAVMQGFPSRSGSALVREGDHHSGLRVVRLARDTAVIEGMDTTWIVVARRPAP